EEALGVVTPPLARGHYDRWLEPSWQRLGHRATAFWADGRAMSLEGAVAYALGETDVAPGSRTGRRALTVREFEVATLLTEGLMNAEIAERLVVSERTVDTHVEHIRNKLGLRRRAQIAAWVTEERARGNT